jgi:hypothetical protein
MLTARKYRHHGPNGPRAGHTPPEDKVFQLDLVALHIEADGHRLAFLNALEEQT